MKKEEDQLEASVISLESLGINSPLDDEKDAKKESESKLELALSEDDKDEDLIGMFSKENEESSQESDEEEESEEEEEEVIEKAKPESNSVYKETLKSLFGEDQIFLKENEDGEEVEVTIDELDLDADTFKEIINEKIEAERNKASENKVSLEGVSDFTKDLIEIDRNGESVSELLQYKEAYLDPLSQIDLSTSAGQREAVALYLRGRQEPEDEIQLRLELYEKKGILSEKAETFTREIKDSISALTAKRKAEAEDAAKQREELFKQYRQDLSNELKDTFDLKDTVRKKLLDKATKRDEKGEYEIDKLYKAARANPRDMALLTLFFEDKEEFIRQISDKKVKEQRIKDASKIRLGGKSGSSSYTGERKEEKRSKDLIPLADFE